MGEFDGFEAMSFDCYGTLIDWETGIADALRPWAARNGLPPDQEWLVRAHARHETRVQQDMPKALYPDVLAETMRRIGTDEGTAVSDDEAQAYGASVRDWPAFEDSAAALNRLCARFRLIIVSNVDRASFARSNAKLGVEFAGIITAEDVGAYKPARAHFDRLFDELDAMGVERSNHVHVAESQYHDLEPARDLGIPSVWIHRRHAKPGEGATATPAGVVEPRWRFTSMETLADVAAGP